MSRTTLGVPIPTIGRLRTAGHTALRGAAITDTPSLDTDLLLGHVLALGRAQLMAHGEALVDGGRAQTFSALIGRRRMGEPMAYLLGEREFFGMRFRVSRDTLIPRPDSETLLEVARDVLADRPALRVVDLGTGTGCLAVAAARIFPMADVWATDANPAACAAATTNAARLGYGDRVTVLSHFFGDTLPAEVETPVDLVLCNPPYLTETEWQETAPDVRDFEPRGALVGGADGLRHYPDVIRTAGAALRRDGWLLLEIGARQADAVGDLLADSEWTAVRVRRDLARRPRVLLAQRRR